MGLVSYFVFKIIILLFILQLFELIIASPRKQLMIRFGLLCLLFTARGVFSLAQVVPDTTHINIGDKTIIVIDSSPLKTPAKSEAGAIEPPVKNDREQQSQLTHFAGIEFGYCQLIDANGSTTRDSSTNWISLNTNRSLTWRLNFLEKKFRIYHDYVGVYTGFAVAFNSYSFSNNVDVISDNVEAGIYAIEVDSKTRNYHKNKLRTTTLQVPLMLEFNTHEDIKRSFHFATGVIGGYVSSCITKQKWQNEIGKFTNRRKEDFQITPWTLDFSARFGYRKTAFFFTYSLTPLFEKNQGVSLYPLTFGIQLSQF